MSIQRCWIFVTPNQPQRSYWGETKYIGVTNKFLIHGSLCISLFYVQRSRWGEIKLNELGRQTLGSLGR